MTYGVAIVVAATASKTLRRLILSGWVLGAVLFYFGWYYPTSFHPPLDAYARVIGMLLGLPLFFLWIRAQFWAIVAWFVRKDWNTFFTTK